MKKILLMLVILFAGVTTAMAQKKAEITFDKTTYDFGSFSDKSPVQSCEFKFKNTGNAMLVINQAIATCGCTIPSYTKEPIRPGESGSIKVTYNGQGKFAGHFKKRITVRTNAQDVVYLFIEGDMTEGSVAKK